MELKRAVILILFCSLISLVNQNEVAFTCVCISPELPKLETTCSLPRVGTIILISKKLLMPHYVLVLCCFRIVFAPKKVPHPSIITFKEKVTDLEPEISPYFCKFKLSVWFCLHRGICLSSNNTTFRNTVNHFILS